ncbi:MAG: hypothetical protein IKW39_00395 [Alphaproteobacteria bacterium]|nr:hypothetical protein [Alphaproteobacteria bacterium]
MKTIFLSLIFFVYTANIYAQNLSTNPWAIPNTKEQIEQTYQKRNNILNNSQTTPQQIQLAKPSENSPTFWDKLKSYFSSSDAQPDNNEVAYPKRVSLPKKIHNKKQPNIAYGSQQPVPSNSTSGFDFSIPKIDTPSISVPKFSTDKFINDASRSIKNTITTIKNQIP